MIRFQVGKARIALTIVGAAAAMLVALPVARADRQPNTNIGAGERSAYDTAMAAGTPEALRHYLDLYPDSPQAAKVLQTLIEDCGKRLQAGGGTKGATTACDLSELIAPAAGSDIITTFTDPPTENSNGRRGSPN
jgi:hypothetical protein